MTTNHVCAHFITQFILCTGCNVQNLNQGEGPGGSMSWVVGLPNNS